MKTALNIKETINQETKKEILSFLNKEKFFVPSTAKTDLEMMPKTYATFTLPYDYYVFIERLSKVMNTSKSNVLTLILSVGIPQYYKQIINNNNKK